MESSPRIPAPLCALALAAALLAGCGGSTSERHPGPPAEWVAYQAIRGSSYSLRVVRLDGTGDEPLPGRAATGAFSPFLSSAAGLVAFTAVQDGAVSLVLQRWSNGAETVLETGDLRPAAPAVSPDGATIAFEGSVGADNGDLYLLPLSGGTPAALAADAAADAGPAWSPDGQTIYFGSARSGAWEVWKVGVDGTGLTPLTTGSGLQGRVSVSPDGQRLAFTRNDDAQVGHVVIHELADGAERILYDGAGESDPAFDGTGQRIAVITRAEGDPEIVIRDVATGALLQRLTRQGDLDVSPAFAR